MPFGAKTDAACQIVRGFKDALFQLGRDLDVVDRTAVRAHDVMVMARQVVSKLVVGELAVSEQPMHHTGRFEVSEIAVDGADRKRVVTIDDLGNRERPPRRREDSDERGPARGEALAVLGEPARDAFA